MELPAEGWKPDPFDRHDERWMSGGTATDLVRDAGVESRDAPGSSTRTEPSATEHWVDVDRLERMDRRAPRSSTPPGIPPTDPTRSRWVAVALTAVSVVVTLAWFPGTHQQNASPHLGRDETIGQVQYVFNGNRFGSPVSYGVTWQAPGHPDSGDGFGSGIATGTASPGTVSAGQPVLVRYDPKDTMIGTIVQVLPPTPVRIPIWVFAGISWAITLFVWSRRRYRRSRGLPERESDVDYRNDEWAGTSYSR